ncbi:MAG: GNAT family N-acetyltransferase [Actinobacteria bacterium]|nr:GNAT family N-acetyltransferase [Actinomycetota bacterium]NCV96033.1 GNAT family N-acetyltransferase [Actinomycetota bacterium]NCW47714.1 GNAT family N-acetyltransferase [Actinomycetota bacterium]NCX33500.1 GNAT family N-acetyltransferase [Actinomycetota bacterium]
MILPVTFEICEESLSSTITSSIRELLSRAFEGDFSEEDWQHSFGGTRLIGRCNGRIVAHGAVTYRPIQFDGIEESTGYVEAIAVDPEFWRQGIGTALMKEITFICLKSYKISMLSTGEKEFYRRLGWIDFVGESYIDLGNEVIRSEEEDEGLMYLPSGEYLVSVPKRVICRARAGDAW